MMPARKAKRDELVISQPKWRQRIGSWGKQSPPTSVGLIPASKQGKEDERNKRALASPEPSSGMLAI